MKDSVTCGCGVKAAISQTVTCSGCHTELPHPMIALSERCEELRAQRNSSTVWMCVATVLVFVLLGLLFFRG